MELYIHIPFCKKKCAYCAFSSFVRKEAETEKYIDLLLKEAEFRMHEAEEPIRTVYIGGGTPSLMSPSLLFRLMNGLRAIFDLSRVEEITAEANPGTVTASWLDTAAACGINRLSLGMQSYQESLLHLLGRIHHHEDVIQSVRLSRQAGIEQISLDLMFGIPTQTETQWIETLDAAMALEPVHISAYGLIPEEKTPLYDELQRGQLHLPDPDTERRMYDEAVRRLALNGFARYEISNFSKIGYECRHNLGYWTQIPYIGLGVSSASMIGIHHDDRGFTYTRRTNPETLEEYAQMIETGGIVPEVEQILAGESRFETMMLGLRMESGVAENNFFNLHGITMDACFGKKLRQLEKAGLLRHENGRWKMTERGFDIQNSILVELMD